MRPWAAQAGIVARELDRDALTFLAGVAAGLRRVPFGRNMGSLLAHIAYMEGAFAALANTGRANCPACGAADFAAPDCRVCRMVTVVRREGAV